MEDVETPPMINHYIFQGTIGKGSFSVVKLLTDSVTHQQFACKVVPRSLLENSKLSNRFENEIRIIQQLRHPGIIQLYDLLKDDNNFYIIMELCSNGELFSHIVENEKLSELESKYFMRQILEALKYVHNLGIVHRDIKPENILIGNDANIKISDFGLSRFVNSGGLADTPCGSPCYIAPECIDGGSYDGKKSDMWSCGVVCYTMLTGQLPWSKKNQTQLYDQIQRADFSYPNYLSEQSKRFISSLMIPNPEERFDINEALSHPWIKSAPIHLMQTKEKKLSLSLKQIDRFFERDNSEIKIEDSSLNRCNSVFCGPIENTLISNLEKDNKQNTHRQIVRNTGNQLLFKRFGLLKNRNSKLLAGN